MTAADLAAAPGTTYDERLANTLDALEATITGTTHGDDSSDSPPDPWVPSEQDGDRAAAVEEGFRLRQQEWFQC